MILRTQNEINDFLEKLQSSTLIALDIETTMFDDKHWSPIQLEIY
jgi:hypothetical protein